MNPTNPKVSAKREDDGNTLHFTLSGVNVSIANAIRRTILSDIETVVFKTSPYSENLANFITNTSRINNEILKQRLSCIPIYLKKEKIENIDDYLLEVNVVNSTDDSIIYVTTKDFVITYKEERLDTREIFRPWISPDQEEHYIEFARLRPKISESIQGEKIHFTCKLSYGTSKDSAMYNCVSACSYGFTIDKQTQEEKLKTKIEEWKKGEQNVDFETKNWLLLEGQRIVLENSFDFIVQTIGVFTNNEIVKKACENITMRLDTVLKSIELNDGLIIDSENTMKNSFDVILENEDYTIGKVIEYMMYIKYFEGLKILTFCAFKKYHPHNTDSLIRIAYKEPTSRENIIDNIRECVEESKEIFINIHKKF
jgi:DNA-directed RNA polymerase alpha subunit